MSKKLFDVYVDFGSSKIIATAFNKKDKKNFSVSSKCFSSFKSKQLNFKDSKIILEKLKYKKFFLIVFELILIFYVDL